MNFELTEDQALIKETAKRFVKKELPMEWVRQCDDEERYPMEPYKKLAELGFLGLPFKKKYGGSDGNILDTVILLEEISKGMTALGAAYMQSVAFGGLSLDDYGSEEQKETYLPKIISGNTLFCLALTEANAGSDVASLKTSAVKDGNYFVINGSKVFITGVQVAEYMLCGVRTNKNVANHKGITMMIVPTKSEGIEIRKLRKLGMKPVGTNEVFFENVRVPVENVVGGVDQGWYNLMKTLNNERCIAAAVCVGSAQACIDGVLQYVKEREQFGRPIGTFQANQHAIVDMQMEVDNARLLAYRAAWLSANHKPCVKETSMAKLYASEAFRNVANMGVQLLGGYGFMMEYDMQRYYRDCKFFEIAGGASQIQRNIIAKELGL
ncbi:MAG: acyl-CoA dehydrogenase [Peptococcaceae bacterium]|nr:MAG: acyl-CoA dehydrogenase [Peptococcaceae bacterium]